MDSRAPSQEQNRHIGPADADTDAVRRLNQKQLARRWGMSHRTLERWRTLGKGPTWMKVGGRVLYRIEDIEHFEQAHMAGGRNPTPR